MQATFGELFHVSNLGVKSLIEITTFVECAVHLQELVTQQVAASIQSENGTRIPMHGSKETDIDVLRDTLTESWTADLSKEDPRFQTLLFGGTADTLEERIEQAVTDPTSASSDTLSLAAKVPLLRETIERLNSQFLEDSLLELLSAALRDRQTHLNVIAARLGWLGDPPKTLQECANLIGLTRERVRQIEDKALKRLPNYSIFLPKLDQALDLLEASVPLSVQDASQLIFAHGLSKKPFSPASVLSAAELLGRKTTLELRWLKGREILVSATGRNEVGSLVRMARKLSGQAGVSSLMEVIDRYASTTTESEPRTRGLGEDDVRRLLVSCQGCEFLNDDWFWFSDIPEGRNRLVNLAKRMLSVASPQSISSVREGTRRVFRYRASTNLRYRALVTPPQAVMAAFFRSHPDFRVIDEKLECKVPLDYRSLLGQGEQVLVEALRSTPSGVLDRRALVEACVARGLNENTVSVYTSYSPIIEHLGLDLWKLRGIQVDPAAVEAVREQNQLRVRQTRLLEYGWTREGRLWIAWKLPNPSVATVLGIPSAVQRYLCGRTFSAINKDTGKALGKLSINETGSSYGYGAFLRHSGADESDTLLTEFDLSKGEVFLSIADSMVLEQG